MPQWCLCPIVMILCDVIQKNDHKSTYRKTQGDQRKLSPQTVHKAKNMGKGRTHRTHQDANTGGDQQSFEQYWKGRKISKSSLQPGLCSA